MLRFVSVPAVERTHGGRPKSRGRPPAAFWGTGRWGGKRRRFQKRGFPRVWTLEWVRAGSAGGQCLRLGVDAPKPHEQGGRQCRRPVPLARWSRKTAPRAGGGLASFRFCSGGRAHTRRQAHEQGPAACGVFGGRGLRESGGCSPKRDSQGSGPLSGCGQSPPFPLRDDFVDTAVPWSAGRHASVPRARRPTSVQRQTAPQTAFPRAINPKIRRATQQRLCPAGANSVEYAPPQRPLPHRGKAASPNAPQATGSCS